MALGALTVWSDDSLHQLEMEPYSVNQAVLELLTILLPQPLKSWEDWDYSMTIHQPHQIHIETLKKMHFKCVCVPTHSARMLVPSFHQEGPSHPAWWLSHLSDPLTSQCLYIHWRTFP